MTARIPLIRKQTRGHRRCERIGRRATPLPIQEGWTRHQEEVAKPPLTERTGWSGMEPFPKNAILNNSSIPTTPSAPLRWLRIFFLMAQPPLLYQEGNCPPQIHSQLCDRAYSGFTITFTGSFVAF